MNDQQIEDYLNRLSDSGDDHSTSQKNYEESDVEDHVELDKMVPTDSDSENDVQPITSRQQVRRSGVILSSDSETEEIPEKLTEPWLRKRHEMPTLKRCLKRKIAEILGETPTIDTPGPSGTQKKEWIVKRGRAGGTYSLATGGGDTSLRDSQDRARTQES
ncbi:unnamed protein product [Colias eurytheme]|nr:unnamed protein product [Colias eurytheme]